MSSTETPEIEIGRDEMAVADAAIEALAEMHVRGDDCPDLFVHCGRLVELVADAITQCLSPRPIEEPRLREILSRAATYAREDTAGQYGPRMIAARVPAWLSRAVMSRGEWPGLRVLAGVARSPVVRSDGTIADTAGYDDASGVWLDIAPEDWDCSVVPNMGSYAATARAAAEILLAVTADFPFADNVARAAWVACVLTPPARRLYQGPSPLFSISANVRGSGKSLLADLAGLIGTGTSPARNPAPKGPEETAKTITSVLLQGPEMCCVDNVSGSFGNAAWDNLLTSPLWQSRILGRSEVVTLPNNTSWCVTGNNVVWRADTGRRVLPIVLESREEHPEDRQDFTHADVLGYVRKNRPGLYLAALQILRSWDAAGRPQSKLRSWGSFEGWGGVVRQAIVFSGLPDPADGRLQVREESDGDGVALRGFVAALEAIDPDGRGCKLADLLDIARGKGMFPDVTAEIVDTLGEAIEALTESTLKNVNTQMLGVKLRAFRNRVIAGRRLEAKTVRGSLRWTAGEVT